MHIPGFFVPGRHPKQTNPVSVCKLQGCALLVVALSDVDAGCVAGETVLQTARTSGVRIPAACEFGLCGTCKVKKVSGDVEMSHNGGILDHEIDDGFILPCCSKPLSTLEIDA